MNECVVCGSDNNLDTELNVSIDNESHLIRVCESCGEDIPLKKIKEIFKRKLNDDDKKQERIKLLLAELGELGYELQPKSKVTKKEKVKESASLQIKPGEKQARRTPSIPQNIPKNASGISLQVHDSYNVNENVSMKDGSEYRAPIDTQTESQIVDIMGVPQRIPRTVEGESGKTSIRIIETSDAEIQRILKQNKNGDHCFGQSGLLVSDCTFCNGTGEARVGNQICPRCKGRGLS